MKYYSYTNSGVILAQFFGVNFSSTTQIQKSVILITFVYNDKRVSQARIFLHRNQLYFRKESCWSQFYQFKGLSKGCRVDKKRDHPEFAEETMIGLFTLQGKVGGKRGGLEMDQPTMDVILSDKSSTGFPGATVAKIIYFTLKLLQVLTLYSFSCQIIRLSFYV